MAFGSGQKQILTPVGHANSRQHRTVEVSEADDVIQWDGYGTLLSSIDSELKRINMMSEPVALRPNRCPSS